MRCQLQAERLKRSHTNISRVVRTAQQQPPEELLRAEHHEYRATRNCVPI